MTNSTKAELQRSSALVAIADNQAPRGPGPDGRSRDGPVVHPSPEGPPRKTEFLFAFFPPFYEDGVVSFFGDNAARGGIQILESFPCRRKLLESMSEEHFFIPVSCGIGTGAVERRACKCQRERRGRR